MRGGYTMRGRDMIGEQVSIRSAPTERVRLSVAEARMLSEHAMRGIGYETEEARILADHVIDAALCGYEYSGLPKLLNVADHPRFKARRSPMRVLRETGVSVLFDGGNQSGMVGDVPRDAGRDRAGKAPRPGTGRRQ